MIEISQIKLQTGSTGPIGSTRPAGSGDSDENGYSSGKAASLLEAKIRKLLRLPQGAAFSWKIVHHSVDARKKPVLYDVYSIRVSFSSEKQEASVLKKCKTGSTNIRQVEEPVYRFPEPSDGAKPLSFRPVIIGFGPAGIFCALKLAEAGYCPVVLERGQKMEDRIRSVAHFWQTGELDPESNIQFGEGGAGTFSDGKLTSNVRDREGRVSEVIRCFLEAGAPGDIAYEQIPHIGTDRLRSVITVLREKITALGGEIRFGTCADALLEENGRVTGVRIRGTGEVIPAEAVILAPGHSARDTVRMLHRMNIPMEAKNFAVGFRVSHPQEMIDKAQYGISDEEERKRLHLPAVSYKLTARAGDGHGVYSFCMCPGGYVVNASSEPKRLAVNGMSDYKRDAKRANSAIVMTVGPEEFGGNEVLDGLRFQERLEEKAWNLAEGKVPVQRFASFEDGKTDESIPSGEELCIRGEAAPAALHTLLPENLTEDFVQGMHQFGKKIQGFDGEDAFVIGLESRTSSPVRILRGENGSSSLAGLFPCGEGAGYAGGIMSAAVDGIRTAEAIGRAFRPVGKEPCGAEAEAGEKI